MYLFSLLTYLTFAALASADWTTEFWDAIIVGAGPAGIIVSYRMAAAGLKTLLLEGGGESYGVTGGDLDSRRPTWLKGTNLTRVDVPGLYKSIFSDQGNLACGNKVNAFGGCTVGGSSAINAGLFFEPPASDYDLYYPTGWKSANMKNATKRLYSMQVSTNITSQDGKRYLQYGYDASRKWLVDGLKFKNVDINGKANDKTEVFGHPIFDYANGQRGGPVTTYLQAALKLPNFHLQTRAQVMHVERKAKRNSKATGVVVQNGNSNKTVKVATQGMFNGFVILSAGALQSPSLLMHSGIGPANILSSLYPARLPSNLKPSDWINSTAVGNRLFDNPNTFIELGGNGSNQAYTYSYDNPPTNDKELYLQKRTGPYTFASETAVFWDNLTHPDGTTVGFQGTIDSSGYAKYNGSDVITLNVYGTSGLKSRGRVVLDKNFVPGPDDKVYYSDPQDGKDIASFIHKIFQGLPGSGLTSLNIAQNSTQAEIEKYITTYSDYAKGQVNHWSSSCELGTCVDTSAKVKGTKNIYVVDGSIIPPVTVNPQFAIMVAAERASELILAEVGKVVV